MSKEIWKKSIVFVLNSYILAAVNSTDIDSELLSPLFSIIRKFVTNASCQEKVIMKVKMKVKV